MSVKSDRPWLLRSQQGVALVYMGQSRVLAAASIALIEVYIILSHIRIGHEIFRRLPRKVCHKNDKVDHLLQEKHWLLALNSV